MAEEPRPHYPALAPIDAYGNGGFRFADMSHRGSLLILPSGIWAWDVERPEQIDANALGQVFAEADLIDLLVIGTGAAPWRVPPTLQQRLREAQIGCEALPTGAATRTYNILLAERRRTAAALIAIE